MFSGSTVIKALFMLRLWMEVMDSGYGGSCKHNKQMSVDSK
jgi:hypothetical protein